MELFLQEVVAILRVAYLVHNFVKDWGQVGLITTENFRVLVLIQACIDETGQMCVWFAFRQALIEDDPEASIPMIDWAHDLFVIAILLF